MSGLGMVLNIAASALAAQQYGMGVTAHNIANVNTEGYSRQDPTLTAKQALRTNGLIMGRGVDADQVARSVDQFVENQFMQEKSSLMSSSEMEGYMQILEGIFDESSGTGISSMLSDFWNSWHEISNNPAGAPERIVLYENSLLMTEQFNALSADLSQVAADLTGAINVGIEKINQITREIAHVNDQIVRMEATGTANDLRDQRNTLIAELAGYIDTKTFAQPNGSITVITAKGVTLVNGASSYDLELGGADGNRVRWQDSSGGYVDITDHISKGKLGGWLEVRDQHLAKYQLDLDSIARELVWNVNQQHTQGVGTKLFGPGTTVTGTSQTTTDLGDLAYGDRISFTANAFNLWIEDRTVPANPVMASVSIDLSGLTTASSLSDLATAINSQIAAAGLAGVTVDGSGSALAFTAGADHAFGFADDASNILAALGVNTYFEGDTAKTIAVNATLQNKDYIAAGTIDATGGYSAGNNRNALAMTDLQFAAVAVDQWIIDRTGGNTKETVTATIEGSYSSLVGSVGITSASVTRGREFNETMVKKLNEVRDSISAVSLDEEMASLIQFQHAYAAATKLISTSDEMLQTLLSLK